MSGETLRVLVADDDINIGRVFQMALAASGCAVDVVPDGQQALARLWAEDYDVLLLDLEMPERDGMEVLRELKGWGLSTEVIILTGYGTVETAVEAMKLGAYDYITKPCKLDELWLLVQRAGERRRLVRENLLLRTRVAHHGRFPDIITQSPAMLAVLDMVAKVAPTDSPVLLQGETGTGKELVARAIHSHSAGREGPFIPVNCGAIPENMLESELFGHERGAFTGAHAQKPGLLEAADSGNLFLDEVGELPGPMQVKLLRAIETGAFFRVGGTREVRVKVRIISATNKDLEAEVAAGRVRQDLYFRLNMFSITLPALRERREDIPLLAAHFLQTGAAAGPKVISPACLSLLQRHAWPGNVRELKHVIHRALILAPGDVIEPDDLPQDLRPQAVAGGRPAPAQSLEAMEREHIQRVLRQVSGHRGRAAEILGVSPKTLYRKLLAYKLNAPKPPPAGPPSGV